MSIQDGGPAFPLGQVGEKVFVTGMSLRDYFAAKAMLVASSLTYEGSKKFTRFEDIANASYGIADAMLAEKAKENK